MSSVHPHPTILGCLVPWTWTVPTYNDIASFFYSSAHYDTVAFLGIAGGSTVGSGIVSASFLANEGM